MNFKKLLLPLPVLALLTLQAHAQDTSVRTLQGWLDFLGKDPNLGAVVTRIGSADSEKNASKVTPEAQMYVWPNRFYIDDTKNGDLDLIAVPNGDPAGSQLIVIAILDPRNGSGIYLPWARRYVFHVPYENRIPREVMAQLLAQ